MVYWAIARSSKSLDKHVKDFKAENNAEAWELARKWLSDDLGANFFIISVAKEIMSPENELIHEFGKKHGQEGMQSYGLGVDNGKKYIRVIILRPLASTVKLPKKFHGLKVIPVLTDGMCRPLSG